MKMRHCFCACVCVLVVAIAAKAQESEGQPGAPKLKTDEPSTGAVVGAASKVSPEDIDKRLSNLEKQLAGLVTQLIAMQPKLVTKDDVAEMIRQSQASSGTPRGNDNRESVTKKDETDKVSETPVTPKSFESKIEPRIAALENAIGKLRQDVDELAKIVAKPGGSTTEERSKTRSGVVIVRNLIGEPQTLFVEGREWRIPGDGRAYQIDVESIRPDNSVVTEVWPTDRARVRPFKFVDGRWEVRFDIVWVQQFP